MIRRAAKAVRHEQKVLGEVGIHCADDHGAWKPNASHYTTTPLPAHTGPPGGCAPHLSLNAERRGLHRLAPAEDVKKPCKA